MHYSCVIISKIWTVLYTACDMMSSYCCRRTFNLTRSLFFTYVSFGALHQTSLSVRFVVMVSFLFFFLNGELVLARSQPYLRVHTAPRHLLTLQSVQIGMGTSSQTSVVAQQCSHYPQGCCSRTTARTRTA